MTQQRNLTRVLALLLLLAMTAGLFPVQAAGLTAATLRLAGFSGTLAVTNASGKKAAPAAGMRLYSGWTVATGRKSGASISLDGTKAVRLDPSTKISVRQSGRTLEVCLLSGRLAFHVAEPLRSTERLNVRTSTMVAGIRGSFGWVTEEELGLLHGHVDLTCTSPVTGQSRTVSLTSGERVRYTQTAAGDPVLAPLGFTRQAVTNDMVPALAIEALKDSAVLQSQVGKDVPTVDVPALLAALPDRLLQEEEALLDRTAELSDTLEEQTPGEDQDLPDLYFKGEAEALTEDLTIAEGETYVIRGRHLTTAGHSIRNNGTLRIEAGAALTIDYGENWLNSEYRNCGVIENDGTIQILNSSLQNGDPNDKEAAGTLYNRGQIVVRNELSNNTGSLLENSGTILVPLENTNYMSNNGTLRNTGTITLDRRFFYNRGGTVENAGDILALEATLENTYGATFTNLPAGSLYCSGTLENGAWLDMYGARLINEGSMVIAGEFITNGAGDQNNQASAMTNRGSIEITETGSLTNEGSMENASHIFNKGSFTNKGTLTGSGRVLGTPVVEKAP